MSQETNTNTYQGGCFCGAVALEVSGEAVGAGYCHCTSCRRWSGGPVNAFTLWKPEAVRITRGAELVAEHRGSARSHRQWCRACGGHLMTRHPEWDLIDVFAATIPSYPFRPGVHVNYAETVLPMHDTLPKLRDFPSELGGSGETLASAQEQDPA
jgi:hypothetical protein